MQFGKLIAELPEQRGKVKAQVQFRHDLLESQKRVKYKNEFDRLQGARRLPGLDANTIGNERITEESKAIIKWHTTSYNLFY